jgi:hypothetical protein
LEGSTSKKTLNLEKFFKNLEELVMPPKLGVVPELRMKNTTTFIISILHTDMTIYNMRMIGQTLDLK